MLLSFLQGCCKWSAIAAAVLALLPPLVYWFDGVPPLYPGRGIDLPTSLAQHKVLITGSTRGIGFHAAREFCARGAQVIVTGRQQAKAAAAAARAEAGGGGAAIPMALDTSDFEDVRRFARSLGDKKLDVMILNAGIAYGPKAPKNTTAPSGHDLAMATNHLGHFLLYKLLRLNIKKGASIVVVGSGTMWAPFSYAQLTPAARPLYESKMKHRRPQAYATSKLANRCFALTLRRRQEGRATVNLYNPGVTATDMLGPRAQHCTKHYFWNWCGGSAPAGRMLMESAFVYSVYGKPADILQAYWWPRFIFQPFVPKERIGMRLKYGKYFGYPGMVERLLRWGTLHATIGPECDVRQQEKLWEWSMNATAAPP